MQVSANIFELAANPVVMIVVWLLIAAHLFLLTMSAIVILLFVWSVFRHDREWSIATFVVVSGAAVYLGLTAVAQWGT